MLAIMKEQCTLNNNIENCKIVFCTQKIYLLCYYSENCCFCFRMFSFSHRLITVEYMTHLYSHFIYCKWFIQPWHLFWSYQLLRNKLKRVPKKNLQNQFCFAYILAGKLPIFKILVSTPHNYGGIMGGKHKNFKDLMLSGQDISKTKFGLLGVFLTRFSYNNF